MAVRRAGAADRDVVRAVRLRALRDAPAAFGSTYEREVAFAASVWDERLRAGGNAHFLWETAHHGAAGIVSVVRDDAGPVARLVGMWVDPRARGTSASDELVEAALRWSELERIPALRLRVVDGNERAERLYLRHGFVRTGRSFDRERDGLSEVEMQRSIPDA